MPAFAKKLFFSKIIQGIDINMKIPSFQNPFKAKTRSCNLLARISWGRPNYLRKIVPSKKLDLFFMLKGEKIPGFFRAIEK